MAQVSISIELGDGNQGKPVKPFSQLTIVQKFFSHHYFELRCPAKVLEGSDEPLLNDSLNYIGKPISIRFKLINVAGAKENVFKGIVTNVSIAKSKGAMGDIIIRGYSPTILLEDGPNCASFANLNLSQTLNKVLEPYDKKFFSNVQNNPQFSGTSPYRVQYNESAFAFIRRLAAMFGEWFFYDGEKLFFGKPSKAETTELYFSRDLSTFNFGLNIRPNTFKHIHYDYNEHELIAGDSSAAKVAGTDTFGNKLEDFSEKVFNNKSQSLMMGWTKAAADRLAELRKSRSAAQMVMVSGTSDNANIRLGQLLNATGVRGTMNMDLDRYGTYLCYGVSHSIDGSGFYSNSFEALQKDLEVLPDYPEFPECETQFAVVKDVDDPEKLGRVKVQFHWQKGDEMTPFIRVAMGHAGKDMGMFFVPEKGEQVLVSFTKGNADWPYVSGSLYHGKAKPWDKAVSESDNNYKIIRTRSGNEIFFSDEDGKEQLLIANKDLKNQIRLHFAEKKITISSVGLIQIQANSIEMKATKKISIEAGEELSIKSGKAMTIKSDDTLSQDSTKEFKISTKDKLSTSSTSDTKIAATTNVSIEGTAKAELKGAQVSVEGTAQAALKAAMVMIN